MSLMINWLIDWFDLPELRTFETKQQAFQDVTTVTFSRMNLLWIIKDTPLLTSITLGQNSFVKSTSLSLSSMIMNHYLIRLSSSYLNLCGRLWILWICIYSFIEKLEFVFIDWLDLPELKSLTVAFYAFKKATSIEFEGMDYSIWIIRSSTIQSFWGSSGCFHRYN